MIINMHAHIITDDFIVGYTIKNNNKTNRKDRRLFYVHWMYHS